MSRFKWHFPSTGGGDEDGINDPLRETFEGDHERYVARESIQNSLDARKDNNSPVLVRFERFNMPVEQIPGLEELGDMLKRAQDYSKNQDKSGAFYAAALSLLQQPTIPVLKVSDFNTIGLGGSDDDTGGGWYKLTRGVGVNSMSGVGGGSFGIGKGAPFAASALRTVFYSTINEEGDHVFKGKARLSSFKDEENDVRRGIGDYGLESERSVSSIRNTDDIPQFFRRSEQGTDIFIIGYQTLGQDWTRLLLNSLLNNFWAAIHFNELDVELAENGEVIHRVNEDNLQELMAEYAADKGDSYNFYLAVKEPSKQIEAVLPRLKEVTLFVKTGESYPKSVQMMRKSKMVVYTIDNYRVLPEPYAAVFICDSDEGNRLLRDLEPPAHDKWDPERNKDFGKQIHKELIGFIRDSLRSMADDKEIEPEDIPELSRWLPEDEERDDMNPYLGSVGEPSGEQADVETAREVGAQRETSEANTVNIRQREVALTQGFARGTDEPPIGTKDVINKTHNAAVDTSESGNVPRINTANIRFRAREINRNGDRIYQAVITSTNDEAGAIKLMAIGDDVDYPVELGNVTDADGHEVSFSGAMIKDLVLKANEPVKLFISLQNKKRYALGVE
jgi:hypothetical protein